MQDNLDLGGVPDPNEVRSSNPNSFDSNSGESDGPATVSSETDIANAAAPQDPVSLRSELRNWRVLEIDGSADPVSEPNLGADEKDPTTRRIPDRQDESIVATMAVRRVEVEAGSAAILSMSVLNNGPLPAAFEVQVEGWVDASWVQTPAVSPAVAPGERATLTVDITPPRRADVEAGDYHIALLVRSPAYAGHITRLGAVLRVLPFAHIEMVIGERPATPVSWLHRSAVVPLQVANQGNTTLNVMLRGSATQGDCTFAFAAPANAAGEAIVALRPGQIVGVPARITVQRPPWFGGRNFLLPFQLEAYGAGEPNAPARRLRSSIAVQPLVGPWQLAAFAGLVVASGLSMVVLALGLFLVGQLMRPALVPAVQAPAAAPPVIIVNLSQPVAAPAAGAEVAGNATVPNASDAPNPSLPLVLPDQVTNPGNGGPVRRVTPSGAGAAVAPLTQPSTAAPSTTSAGDSASLTYGQMFQEIGQRYDLDWKMMAAQAYVESGFDTLALSDAGAMGLMQVLPNTWREWAPAANASDPFDSYSNVAVAAVYLDHLRTQFAAKGYPGKEWMLIAYNWGPDRLNDFLVGGGVWETLPEARRQYAEEVLRIAKTIP